MAWTLTKSKVIGTHYYWYALILIRLRGFCSHYHENYKHKSQHKGRHCVKWMLEEMINIRSAKRCRRINSCKEILCMQLRNICSFNPTHFIYKIPTGANIPHFPIFSDALLDFPVHKLVITSTADHKPVIWKNVVSYVNKRKSLKRINQIKCFCWLSITMI